MSQVLQLTNYVGYYLTPSALTTAIPVGFQSAWAIVQLDNSIYIWNVQSQAWAQNGSGSGTVTSVTGNIVNNTDPANPIVTQQQADWTETDNMIPDYIKNKPDLAAITIDGGTF